MLFSIIIPAYNEEKHLPACLQSLKEQDFIEGYEVIVIDNGSTDITPEIVKEYGATLLINKEKNVSGLRNLGAETAKGEVLAFIDADCTAEKNWLTSAAKYIQDTDIAGWGAAPYVPNDATWVQKSWLNLRKKTQQITSVEWLESMNLFVRKKTFQEVGGFNEKLITCEDVDFCYRLGEKGELISDNRIHVIHMGEAATVKIFIKKEFWRGISNYHGLFSHKFKFSELPSFLLPIYFALFLPIVIIFACNVNSFVSNMLAIGFILSPALAVWIKLYKKHLDFIEMVQLEYLIHIYFIVRTISAFKGILKK